MLQIAGAITTYLIIVLQFQDQSEATSNKTLDEKTLTLMQSEEMLKIEVVNKSFLLN